MIAALICREFGWTWQQYQEQPTWFLETCFSMLQNEAAERKRQADAK